MKTLNNTETEEECIELLKRITNRRNIFQKLVKTVSNPVEKKRIVNIIETVDNVLDYFSSTDQSSQSGFSNDIKGRSLKILTPNQMLSRLPITLAQLKARNNSEKLKN